MRFHLFRFRTEKLSSLTPMVLRFSRGRVGSRLFKVRSLDLTFFYAPFRAPALQLPEKQIIRNGLAAMAAKKIGKIFRDLPERAIRPIRIRGALYLRMPFFTLCYWRRFDCGGIVDRETLLLPPVQFAIIPVCTGITGSSGFIKTIAPVFRQLPWRILR